MERKPEAKQPIPSDEQSPILRGGIYDVFPDHHSLILHARDILRQVMEKTIEPEILDALLDNPKSEKLLTTQYADLGNLSVLAYLRQELEREKLQEDLKKARTVFQAPKPVNAQSLSEIVATTNKSITETTEEYSKSMAKNYKPVNPSERVNRNRRIKPRALEPKVNIISSVQDIAKYEKDISFLHLSTEALFNLTNIQSILSRYSQIKTIQCPPSSSRLIGPGIRQLLDKHGVELRFARIREGRQYDDIRVTGSYLKEKKVYVDLEIDPTKKEALQKMEQFELDELLIAKLYWGDKRVSMREVADRLGFSHAYVQARLSVFKVWMGLPVRDKRYGQAAILSSKLNRLREAEKPGLRDEFRRSFAVGEYLPPTNIPIQRWEIWQKLIQLKKSHPEVINHFREQNPRSYTILSELYQMDGGNTYITYKRLGEQFGISRERIKQLKNLALTDLGLLENK